MGLRNAVHNILREPHTHALVDIDEPGDRVLSNDRADIASNQKLVNQALAQSVSHRGDGRYEMRGLEIQFRELYMTRGYCQLIDRQDSSRHVGIALDGDGVLSYRHFR